MSYRGSIDPCRWIVALTAGRDVTLNNARQLAAPVFAARRATLARPLLDLYFMLAWLARMIERFRKSQAQEARPWRFWVSPDDPEGK